MPEPNLKNLFQSVAKFETLRRDKTNCLNLTSDDLTRSAVLDQITGDRNNSELANLFLQLKSPANPETKDTIPDFLSIIMKGTLAWRIEENAKRYLGLRKEIYNACYNLNEHGISIEQRALIRGAREVYLLGEIQYTAPNVLVSYFKRREDTIPELEQLKEFLNLGWIKEKENCYKELLQLHFEKPEMKHLDSAIGELFCSLGMAKMDYYSSGEPCRILDAEMGDGIFINQNDVAVFAKTLYEVLSQK